MFETDVRRNRGEQVTVRVRGSLVLGEATVRFRACLQSVTDRYGTIVVEASQLERIDSAGLGELVRAYSDARSHGAVIRLEGVQARIHDLLVLTKLVTVFDVEPVRSAA